MSNIIFNAEWTGTGWYASLHEDFRGGPSVNTTFRVCDSDMGRWEVDPICRRGGYGTPFLAESKADFDGKMSKYLND